MISFTYWNGGLSAGRNMGMTMYDMESWPGSSIISITGTQWFLGSARSSFVLSIWAMRTSSVARQTFLMHTHLPSSAYASKRWPYGTLRLKEIDPSGQHTFKGTASSGSSGLLPVARCFSFIPSPRCWWFLVSQDHNMGVFMSFDCPDKGRRTKGWLG